jgi:hypothetical protein
MEPAGGSGSASDLGTSPHDVRPLHGGAAFYGFPSFGSKPGVCQQRVVDTPHLLSHQVCARGCLVHPQLIPLEQFSPLLLLCEC